MIIRLLDPTAYGLMAMAMATISWSAMISDLGLTASVVRSALDRPATAALQGAIVLFNFGVCGLMILGAPIVSAYYGTDLTELLRLLAVTFAVGSFGRIQEAILIREMRFRTRSVIESGASLLDAGTAVMLAWYGFGVWALAIGSFIHALARSVLYTAAGTETIWPSLRLGLAWPYIKFGFMISCARTMSWLVDNVDVFILGRVQAAPIVGLYSVSKNFSLLPVAKLGSTLTPLGFSVFSRLADDRARQRAALLESLAMIVVVTVPIAAMISALAPDIRSVLLGPKWAGAEVALRLMSLAIPLILMSSQLNVLLMAIGLIRPLINNKFVALALISISVGVGTCWGFPGAAVGWSLGYAAGWAVALARTRRYTLVGFADLFVMSWRSLVSAAAGYLATMAVRHLADGLFTPLVLLASLAAIGGVTYLATLALLDRRQLLKVIAFLRT